MKKLFILITIIFVVGSINVFADSIPMEDFILDGSTCYEVGKTYQLKVVKLPYNTTDTGEFVFSSESDNVTITSNGLLYTKNVGEFEINLEHPELSATTYAEVKETCDNSLSSMSFYENDVNVILNETYYLVLNNITDLYGNNIYWYSEDDSIATIENYSHSYSNTVTAVSKGTTYIHAVSGNVEAICKVTVNSDLDISKTNIWDIDEILTYDGTEKRPTIIITNGNGALTEGIDYKLTYNNNINAGNATVLIEGIGNYTNSVLKTFKIDKATYNMANVVFNDNIVTYDGKSHSLRAYNLPKGVSVSYVNNNKTNSGIYNVTANFEGDSKNYNAIESKTAKLTINKATYNLNGITFNNKVFYYDGQQHSILVENLPEGLNVNYTNNNKSDVGIYNVTARLTNNNSNYNDINTTLNAVLEIKENKYDLSKIVFEDKVFSYDGKEHKIEATNIPDNVNVTYTNNNKINSGDYEVTAIFTDNSGITIGTKTARLTINKMNISNANISKISDQIYNGKKIEVFPLITLNNNTLKRNASYTVKFNNNINTGVASVIIEGLGNYTGKKIITFNIIPAKVSGLKVKTQTTTSITLNWKNNGSYIDGYKIYVYNTKSKKYKLVGSTTKTTYKVSNLKAGTNYKFKVRAYKNSNKELVGIYSNDINTTTKTKKPTIKKATSKNRKVTIKWNKVSGAEKYQIFMSEKKNSGYKRSKTTNGLVYTRKKLKKGKTYYFKIRTYKTVNGKKIYSYFSKVKKIKIK